MVAAQDHQAQGGAPHPDEGGAVVLVLLPLGEEHHHEQGGHDELNPRGVKLDEVPQQGTQGGPCHPVDLVEDGDEKHEPPPVDPRRRGHGAVDGEGLVTQAEDEVGLFPPQVLKLVQHGQAVEEVPGVDHQGQQEGVEGLEGGQQQEVRRHKLHGAGKDEHAHKQGVPHRKPLAAHEKPIGHA